MVGYFWLLNFIETPSKNLLEIMPDVEKGEEVTATADSVPRTSASDNDSSSKTEQKKGTHTTAIEPQEVESSAILSLFRRKKKKHDLNAIATQPSIFDDPVQAAHWKPHPKYENLHRFDPDEKWTWAEELVRFNLSFAAIIC